MIAHQESKVIPFRPRRSAPSVGRSLALEMSAALLAVVLLNMAIVLIYSGAM